MANNKNPAACSHCNGFTFRSGLLVGVVDYPSVFWCNKDCGFYLNFDPAKFPNTVAFLSFDEIREKEKTLKDPPDLVFPLAKPGPS